MITCSSFCFGQSSKVLISKDTCTYNKKYSGYKLIIQYDTDTTQLKSEFHPWLNNFIKLPDSIKFLIIEKLLEFENDSSLCCMPATNYSFNGIDGCRDKPNDIKRYTIQIDALFMINRLCWPTLMELYSCSHVLYDNITKKTINHEPTKIKFVFEEYRKWFLEQKTKGKIDRYFPFNDGRYTWYGGRKSLEPKENY